jgi:hypothetical protein
MNPSCSFDFPPTVNTAFRHAGLYKLSFPISARIHEKPPAQRCAATGPGFLDHSI